MKKSIEIELLQDRSFGGATPVVTEISRQLLANNGFTGSANGWDLTTQMGSGTPLWTYHSNTLRKTSTATNSFFSQVRVMAENVKYKIQVRVKDFNGSGDLQLRDHGVGGANITLADNTLIPPGTAGTTGNGYVTLTSTFVQGHINLDKLFLRGAASTVITIDYVCLWQVGMNQSLVVGKLDGINPEDFPFAMTFAINDATNIEARMGSYSKTFQIPATSNNNIILKRMNIANSTNLGAQLNFKIPCRISFGGTYAVVGLIQFKDVIIINNKAITYSCVFYGDNVGWGTELENKYLKDLTFPNSTNLPVTAKAITATWSQDDATTTTEYNGTSSENTSPIVYPVATYGPTNETGVEDTFQLLRQYWEKHLEANGSGYDTSDTGVYGPNTVRFSTPSPVLDWKPMLWIYKMFHNIFNSIGYVVSSNFIEGSDFKKLLYATPNCEYNDPDSRYQNLSNTSDFSGSGGSLSGVNLRWHQETYSKSITWSAPAAADELYETSITDTTIGPLTVSPLFQTTLDSDTTIGYTGTYTYWTIGESGYYSLEAGNMLFRYSGGTWSSSTSGNMMLKLAPALFWECKTVSLSGWEPLELTITSGFQDAYKKGDGYHTTWDEIQISSNAHETFLNKGDQVRLFLKVGMEFHDGNPTNGEVTTVDDLHWDLLGTTVDSFNSNVPVSADGFVNVTLLNPSRLEYNSTYNLVDIIPKDHKQLDFIKGLAHCFNLQFQTNSYTKTVSIEPFSDFYLPPKDAVDWTYRLDRGKEIKDAWIDSDFKRRLIFKYKSDDKDSMTEYMADAYFDGIQDMYPYWEYLSDGYPTGDTIFENPFFAGSYESMTNTEMVTGLNNFYSASLWEFYNGNFSKGYDFLPRILSYAKKDFGTQNAPNTQSNYINMNSYRGFNAQWWGSMEVERNWNARISWADWVDSRSVNTFPPAQTYGANYPSSPYLPYGINWYHAFIPQCTFINRLEYTNSFGLSYGNYMAADYEQDGGSPYAPAYTGQIYGTESITTGLYHRYYKSMVDNLIQYPKLRTCYVDLKVKDIQNLDFSKLVYIDGIYYKLIKIIDWQPHLSAPTKVELHQYNPATGAGLPQNAVWISLQSIGGGGWNPNGSEKMPTGPLPY